MPGIVCAIRGGPASRITINKAVKIAKEKALPLTFLYVVNIDFLSHTPSSRVQLITQEMEQMGDFILLAAQERAQAMGISAKGEVRRGTVGEEIINLCHKTGADYVVLGLPQGQEDEDVFNHERLHEFSQRIERESGARVILVEGLEDE